MAQQTTFRSKAPFPAEADLHTWAAELDVVGARLAPRFERSEPRRRVLAYLTGLLSNAERKNSWQLAELAGEASPDGMQRLVSTAHWDADVVRDDLVAYVLEQLAEPQAVLVLDETGFVKKGAKSVGVAPQYCGAVGKIANCQIGVFLAYATTAGPVLLDRELYRPKTWVEDAERRAEAGVPPQVTAQTKPALGQALLERALLERAFAAGVRAAWVTADSIYGGAYALRHFLEEREQPFVLAVPSTQRIGLTEKAAQVVGSWLPEAWERLSAGEGSQGPRWYDWACRTLPWRDAPAGMARVLLARRSVSQPEECAYYFVFGPTTVTLAQLALVAGTRWQVEQAFELAKGAVGLDEYAVRTWTGWYRHPRHLGPVCPRLPHARAAACTGHTAEAQKGASADPDRVVRAMELLPLTVPEVRRLLFALVWQPPPLATHILHWSAWRRRHQAQAKHAHIRRRQHRAEVRL